MSDDERKQAEAMKQRLESAKPQISLVHHVAAILTHGRKLTIHLSDGRVCDGELDSSFTDGLSLVNAGLRTYFPLNSIVSIMVHNPI
jgi:hypothetical protein